MILLICIIVFLMLHKTLRFTDRYPSGWRQITRYAIGVLCTYPFFLMHLKNREKPNNAYLLAFLGSGIGTAFGYMSDEK